MSPSWCILICLIASSFAVYPFIVLPVCCGYTDPTNNSSNEFTIGVPECIEPLENATTIFQNNWKGHTIEWEFTAAPLACYGYYSVSEDELDIYDGSISHRCAENDCCGNPIPKVVQRIDWKENRAFCMDYFEGKFYAHFCFAEETKYLRSFSPLKKICMIISAIMLVITCVVHLTAKSVRKENYVPYLVSQSMSLAIYFIIHILCLARIHFAREVNHCWECLMMGYCLQYSFIAAFFWMNAKCINVYKTVSQLRTNSKRRMAAILRRRECMLFSLYAWGVPLLITAATYSIQMTEVITDPRMRPDIGISTCFFTRSSVKWIYFYGPIAILIAANFILFTLTAAIIVKQQSNIFSKRITERDKSRLQKEIWFFNQYIKLFIVTGISWAGEVLEVGFGSEEDSWQKTTFEAIDIFNSLQGVFIFYLFVCQKEVLGILCCWQAGRKTSVVKSANKHKTSTAAEDETSCTHTQIYPHTGPRTELTSNRTLSSVFNKSIESVTFECVEMGEKSQQQKKMEINSSKA